MTVTTPPTKVGPRIKGTAFVHLAEYVREKFGDAALREIAANVSPEAAKSLLHGVAFEWHPFKELVELEKALAELYLGGDYARIADFGKWDGIRQIGLYRFLLQVLNTDFLLKRSPKLWKNYCDSGQLTYTSLGEKHAKLMFSGYEPLHEVHCADLLGGFFGTVETCGGKDVKVAHTHCRLKGAPECVFEVRCS